jgi:hypothetical protein
MGNENATAHLPASSMIPSDVSEQVNKPASEIVVDNNGLMQETINNAQAVEKPMPPKTPLLIFGENDEKYLASTPSAKQKEILDLFSDEEFTLIVRKLFANDEPAFRGAVTEISLLRTWEQVAQYLDKLFLINQTDPFSAEAVGFTDKLYAHFHPSVDHT